MHSPYEMKIRSLAILHWLLVVQQQVLDFHLLLKMLGCTLEREEFLKIFFNVDLYPSLNLQSFTGYLTISD